MANFTFDFDLADDLDDEFDLIPAPSQINSEAETGPTLSHEIALFSEIFVSELLDVVPESISYSPLHIPHSSGRAPVALARRDLFDARLQVISREGADDEDKTGALDFLAAPSDLVPGVYEGGLKTWECSVDLAECLEAQAAEEGADWLKGKRVLELGCGTAVPTLVLLHQLFAALATSEETASIETHIHLQDYNRSVLELVTLPNILLVWYMSPLSSAYRASQPDPPDDADPQTPGELSFPSELKQAFLDTLSRHRVHLRFFSGSWDGLDVNVIWNSNPTPDPSSKGPRETKYDIVLTSETIYRTDSLPALLRALRHASLGAPSLTEDATTELVEKTANISLCGGTGQSKSSLCLVAAKVLYFGVGGGVETFVKAIEDQDLGTVETIWERTEGVGRRVMRILWR